MSDLREKAKKLREEHNRFNTKSGFYCNSCAHPHPCPTFDFCEDVLQAIVDAKPREVTDKDAIQILRGYWRFTSADIKHELLEAFVVNKLTTSQTGTRSVATGAMSPRPSSMTNDNCDGAGPHTEGEVRSLPIGHGNTILCRRCWANEMHWRNRMNAQFQEEHPERFSELMFLVSSWSLQSARKEETE